MATSGEPTEGLSADTSAVAREDAPTPSRVPGRGVRLAALVGPPVGYALIASFYFSHFLRHPTHGVPGGADGILYSWYFESVEQSLIHLHNPLVSAYMNVPHGVNVMWNTAVFAVAAICVPLTAAVGPIAAVGFMMVLAPIASASTCYYVLRRLTGRAPTSALVSTIYGFGPYFAGQQGHLHLSIGVFPPLVLLLGRRLLVDQTRSAIRTGLWLGVVVALQLLTAEEVVVITAVVALSSAALLAALYRGAVGTKFRHAAVGLAVGAATAIAVAGVPLAYQFFGPNALHGFKVSGLRVDMAALVRPGVLQYFAPDADTRANLGYSRNTVESTGYLGWPLLVLVLALSVYFSVRRDRFGYWWLGSFVCAVVLSLGSPVHLDGADIGPGPWRVLRQVPLVGGVVPPRFSLVTTLLVALILARWLGRLHGRALAGGALIVIAAMVPLVPAGPYGEISVVRTPRFFATSAVEVIPQGAAAFVLPYGTGPDPSAQVMFWQIRAHLRFRLIGGYSVFKVSGKMTYHAEEPKFGRLLSATGARGELPTSAQIRAAQNGVAVSGVQYVVVTDQQPNAQAVVRAARQLTRCAPRRVADVTVCALPPGGASG